MKNKYYTNHKTFLKAYDLLSSDHRKYKKFYLDKRLTQVEKNLLKSLFSLKKGKFQEATDFLSLCSDMNEFIQGFYYHFLSILQNRSGNYFIALDSGDLSIQAFNKANDDQYIFYSIAQQVVTAGNTKDLTITQKYFDQLEHYDHSGSKRQSYYLRCRSVVSLLDNRPEDCLKDLNYCIKNLTKDVEDRISFYYVMKFMAEFNLSRIDDCSSTLEEYKNLGGHKVKPNYLYMNSLLKFIYNNSPIYAYKRDFKDAPILKFELNVIKHLFLKDVAAAKVYWIKLSNLNSQIYCTDFNFQGSDCLFSVALEKVKVDDLWLNLEEEQNFQDLGQYKNTSDKLAYLLESATRPLDEEEIIKLLWNEEYSQKSISRLRAQISRLRKANSIEINYENNCYYLIKTSAG